MKLTIRQGNTAEHVTSTIIDDLYNLSHGENLTQDSELEGYLTTQAAYEDAVEYLTDTYPNLTIVSAAYYIRFADPYVLEALINAGFGDGVGITTANAAVDNISNTFVNNKSITSFEEFKYYTSRNQSGMSFVGCSNLERVDISNCSKLPTFSNCNNLEYFNGSNSERGVVYIPEGVESDNGRWTSCSKVLELHFPDSFKTIGQSVFEYLSGLQKVYFGTGISKISGNAFYSCSALQEVHIKSLDVWLDIDFIWTNGVLTQANPLYHAHHLYVDNNDGTSTEITSIDFTNSLAVKNDVMEGCKGLTSVVLPSSLLSIGDAAFKDCSNLVIQSLDIQNLASIGIRAFQNTKLKQITNLGDVSTISDSCFENCTNLLLVNISPNVTAINNNAFKGCSGLQTVNITDIDAWVNINFKNNYSNPVSIAHNLYLNGNLINSFDFTGKNQVKQYVFYGCSNLSDVTIPNTVTSIGNYAFANTGLTELSIPDGTIIGECIVEGCELSSLVATSTTFVRLHKSYTGDYTVPTGVTTIKDYAFNGCSTLTDAVIPNTVTSIGVNTFLGSSIRNIVIPDSVNGTSPSFEHINTLVSIKLGNGITSVSRLGRNGIQSLDLGTGITKLERQTWYNTQGTLRTLIVRATTPPSVSNANNENALSPLCNIYVPAESVDAYKAAPYWSTYKDQIKDIANL